ncbi:hypothetical protein HPB51_023974 [Rhipicephalus microplus]|uniref:CCHC-type domain-containing protein n=1 Tax=Rhipicephalus microplus TaxID=6941 RepID=A0A9J6EV24_RHIMP|nr:hypothetical protein HPB51_023974 [Rhipicephalus microplus]
MLCRNLQQNIIVVSTPIEAHADKYQFLAHITFGKKMYETSAYEVAPDYTSKGVIHGIPLEDSAHDISSNVVITINLTALADKRLSNTTPGLVLFEVFRVLTYVCYGGALLRCTLYRKQVDTCYHCGGRGHRADVCSNPQDRICRGCGAPSPPKTTSVHKHGNPAEATIIQPTGPAGHDTRQTPYIVTRRHWEGQQQVSPKPTASSNDANQQNTLPPRPHGGRGRPKSRTHSRFESRSRGTTPGLYKLRWADVVAGTQHRSEEAASQNALKKLVGDS